MDIEEIREHKAKAEQEIAAALASILYRLVEVTGQARNRLQSRASHTTKGGAQTRS